MSLHCEPFLELIYVKITFIQILAASADRVRKISQEVFGMNIYIYVYIYIKYVKSSKFML